jgi:hypothetical protein
MVLFFWGVHMVLAGKNQVLEFWCSRGFEWLILQQLPPVIHSDTQILADRKVQRLMPGTILQRGGGTGV